MEKHRAAFTGDESGVRTARAWLWGYIDGHARAGDVALVATELCSNAIAHTASQGWLFALTVERDEAGTRITVADFGGDDKPELREFGCANMHGHGLALVDALADAWGTEGDVFGRDVWAWFNA